MAKKETVEKKTEELLIPILEKNELKLWDVEYVKEAGEWYLRAFIDKDQGVTINECVKVSRELSDLLDRDDFINDPYILEVSSPGLTRTLKRERDFENSIGRLVTIRLYKAEDGRKEMDGILKAFDKENMVFEIDGTERSFARKELALIKLAME